MAKSFGKTTAASTKNGDSDRQRERDGSATNLSADGKKTSSGKKRPRERDSDVVTVMVSGESSGGSTPPPITANLATFLHPMPVEQFLSEYYQPVAGRCKALVCRVSPAQREARLAHLRAAMHHFHPVRMLESSASLEGGGINVWMKDPKNPSTVGTLKVTDAAQAVMCYKAGSNLYFRGSEALEAEFVPALLDQLGHGARFASFYRNGDRRGEIEVFASHVGHTTNWHWDFQENFTVQLQGTKRWYLYNRPDTSTPTTTTDKREGEEGEEGSVCGASVASPHRAMALHFGAIGGPAVDPVGHRHTISSTHMQHALHKCANSRFGGALPADIEAQCESVVLHPGDVLYHPAGIWHRVETIGATSSSSSSSSSETPPQNSLSINISLFPETWGGLVLDALQQHLVQNALFRQRVCLPRSQHHSLEEQQSLHAALAVRLRALADDLLASTRSTASTYHSNNNTGGGDQAPARIGRLHPGAVLPPDLVQRNRRLQAVVIGPDSARCPELYATDATNASARASLVPLARSGASNETSDITTTGQTNGGCSEQQHQQQCHHPVFDCIDAVARGASFLRTTMGALTYTSREGCCSVPDDATDDEAREQLFQLPVPVLSWTPQSSVEEDDEDANGDNSDEEGEEDDDSSPTDHVPLAQLFAQRGSHKCALRPRDARRFDYHHSFVGESEDGPMISTGHCVLLAHRRWVPALCRLAAVDTGSPGQPSVFNATALRHLCHKDDVSSDRKSPSIFEDLAWHTIVGTLVYLGFFALVS